MDDGSFFFVCLVSILIFGGLGYRIGSSKGLAGLGAALGGLLGPIGLIIVAILPNEDADRLNEPRRFTRPEPQLIFEDDVPVPRIVPSVKIVPRTTPKAVRYFICQPGAPEISGPYDETQIESLRSLKIITDNTLFCLEGTEGWLKKSP